MKCKLVNSRKKTMKFCRFLRINDDVGYNLEEGRGEGRIKYYGNGFKSIECGISVDKPDDIDKSAWKCFIGVENDDGELKTLGAVIDPQSETQGGISFTIFANTKVFTRNENDGKCTKSICDYIFWQ